ncbi:hypothetical protein Tco_0046480 [Tanacetum coccineum]
MSTNEQNPLSQPTFVVRNTLGKEPVLQDPGRPIPDEALPHIIPSQEHQSKEGVLRKGSDQGFGKENGVQKIGIGLEIRGRVYPCTQMTQGVGHTTVAAETLKVATKVLVQEQRNPLLRDVITKRHPREERRSCQKVKRDEESTEEFIRRYKLECRDVKGALECIKISGFMHEITNIELIKRLHNKIPKSVDEMMRVTTAFLRGEVAASNRFRSQQRSERKQDRFTLLTKTPKEIFALDKGKFKALPPMTTPVEKQNHAKFCEFHGEVGHSTDECMHLRKQIEEMIKAVKLSHLIKELKQNNGKEKPKVTKKGETSGKNKALSILMVQPWERVARQRITQSFSLNPEIFFLRPRGR